jgi:hypothetical protein
MAQWVLIFALMWSNYVLLYQVAREATEGYSLVGCYIRGLHNINDGACK